MDIVFVTAVAVIAPDPAQSRKLYVDALGLPLAAAEGSEYWHSEQLAGTKSFGIWPLREAAQACFGQPEWPAHLPAPQASIEFEVADGPAVEAAAHELEARGFALLHRPAPGAVGANRRPCALGREPYRRRLVRAVPARGPRTRVGEHPPRCRQEEGPQPHHLRMGCGKRCWGSASSSSSYVPPTSYVPACA